MASPHTKHDHFSVSVSNEDNEDVICKSDRKDEQVQIKLKKKQHWPCQTAHVFITLKLDPTKKDGSKKKKNWKWALVKIVELIIHFKNIFFIIILNFILIY